MKTHRRRFLKYGLTQAAVMTLPSLFSKKAESQVVNPSRTEATRRLFSVAQGATDSTSTQFSIMHEVQQEIQVRVMNAQGFQHQAALNQVFQHPGSTLRITQLGFDGLDSQGLYTLIIESTGPNPVRDQRTFRMLHSNRSQLKFAICSCMDDAKHKADIWREVAAQTPDALFFIGDSVYADRYAGGSRSAPPSQLWSRFCEARSHLEVYFLPHLVPIFATWDDHDYGANDSGEDYAFARESLVNFNTFFAQDPRFCATLVRGPGVSSFVTIAGNNFLLLDDRTFRKFRGSRNRFAHWGQQQEEWAFQQMQGATGPIWIMNGSQFFPSVFWKESVSGDHPAQFEGFIQRLKELPNRVVFVSGDVHYSELIGLEPTILGYPSFEITSSSVHSDSIPGVLLLSQHSRRLRATSRRNFVVISAQSRGMGLSFGVESRSANNVVNFGGRHSIL